MLQGLRDYFPKWVFAFFLGLLGVLIVGTGIYLPSGMGASSQNAVLARINGVKIRKGQLDAVCKFAKQQQMQMGNTLTPDMEVGLRANVFRHLVNDEMLKQRAYANNYRIHLQSILGFIKQIPNFQVEGTFAPQRFAEFLSARGQTKSSFFKTIAEDQVARQPVTAIMQSAFILPKETPQFVRFLHQKRDFNYCELKAEHFLKSVAPLSEEVLREYYEESLTAFRIPEFVSIKYIILSYQDSLKAVKEAYPEDKALWEEKAAEKFTALKKKLTELNDKHPSSLEKITQALNVKCETTPLFTRQGGTDEITKHPDVLAAAFSPKVLQGDNSALLPLDSERVILLSVKQHEPLRLPSFEEVKDKVKAKLTLEKAKEAAHNYGKELVAKLQKEPSAAISLPSDAKWQIREKVKQDDQTTPAFILHAAFSMPYHAQEKRVKGIAMPNGDYIVIRLTKVSHGKISELQEREYESYKAELKQMLGQSDSIRYIYANEKRVKIDYFFDDGS